jgi:predicted metal-binding membrane protein
MAAMPGMEMSDARGAHQAAGVLVVTGWGRAWLLMCAAMMIPPALPAMRHLALTAMWRRRQRTVAVFVGTYLGVWAAFGVVALFTIAVMGDLTGASVREVVVAALAVGGIWELTTWKRESLRACHMLRPIPPRGLAADRACMRESVHVASSCARGCWAIMIAAAAGAGLAVMALATALMLFQVVATRGTRVGGPAAVLILGCALATVLGA